MFESHLRQVWTSVKDIPRADRRRQAQSDHEVAALVDEYEVSRKGIISVLESRSGGLTTAADKATAEYFLISESQVRRLRGKAALTRRTRKRKSSKKL